MAPRPATRRNGVCRGTLWKQHCSVAVPPTDLSFFSSSSSSSANNKNERSKSNDYCILIGNTLSSYTDLKSYQRGDFPQSEVRIVGASAWNPVTKNNATNSTTFRIVTYAGTHIYCSAPTIPDRDIWLEALHSGLEASYTLYHETLKPNGPDDDEQEDEEIDAEDRQLYYSSLSSPSQKILVPPQPQNIRHRTTRQIGVITINPSPYLNYKPCTSCAGYFPESEFHPASVALPQYGMELRVDLCTNCQKAQGLLAHVTALSGLYASYAHERAALQAAAKAAIQTVDRAIREAKSILNHSVILNQQPELAKEGGQQTKNNNNKSNTYTGDELYESWASISNSDKNNTASSSMKESTTQKNEILSASTSSNAQQWHYISPTDAGTKALIQLIQTPGFLTYRRRSRALEIQCRRLESGSVGGAAEFLEVLADSASAAPIIANYNPSVVDELGVVGTKLERGGMSSLKREAFKVAGDMSTAIKLLAVHALPNARVLDANQFLSSNEMLATILEFLLDLCEEGEIGAISFFWPQLRHIHLRMLPAKDADELMRAELMEDFLITVSTKYSMHLGLELIWGLIADLEESFEDPNNASPLCRARRFPVLRFLCELESILFDFEGGWGGGNVCLKDILRPSTHQATLTRDAMAVLQLHRRFSGHHLTRSVRVAKLKRDAKVRYHENKDDGSFNITSLDSEERENLKERAEYFSTQLSFAKKLGDIAEKLRFLDVEKRSSALQKELALLNAQGKLGGDVLSRAGEGISRVVRIPDNEGHVFRSKERTPVLLLYEVIRPEISDEEHENESLTDEERVDDIDEEEKEEKDMGTNSLSNVDSQATDENTSDEEKEQEHNSCDMILCDGEDQSIKGSSDLADDDEKKLSDEPLTPRTSSEALALSIENPSTHSVFKEHKLTPRGRALKRLSVEPETPLPRFDTSETEMEDLVASVVRDRLTESESSITAVKTDAVDNTVGNEDGAISGMIDTIPPPPLIPTCEEKNEGVKEDVEDNSNEEAIETEMKIEAEAEIEETAPDVFDSIPPSNSFIMVDDSKSEKESSDASTELSTINTSTHGTKAENQGTIGGQTNNARKLMRRQSSKKITSKKGRMSAFGSFGKSFRNPEGGTNKKTAPLGVSGEGRREVLTTILNMGMRGDIVARGAAKAAKTLVQAMDKKRAEKLIMKSNEDEESLNSKKDLNSEPSSKIEDFARKSTSNNNPDQESDSVATADESLDLNDDGEVLEALRLLLIQNKVAQDRLNATDAELTQRLLQESYAGENERLGEGVSDAGELDTRLAGCGPLSAAIVSAFHMWKDGTVTNGEVLELVQKDLRFLRQSAFPGFDEAVKLFEDSAFWVRFAFGERWAEKKSRIAATSPHGAKEGWDLSGLIVKSNDDLRQEAFVMQLIELCEEAFENAGLELWLKPYRILATSRRTGVIETVQNAISFDGLKKRDGYGDGGLRGHLLRMSEFEADPSEAFKESQVNFVRSLAAYSLLSYFFMFKDRHNGNLLMDTAGHVIHIDFGFVFGIAPGGSFSLEMSTPFKLTEEMLDVMGGPKSPLFSEFVTLFCCGFLAMQAHVDTFCTVVEITCEGSSFPCFEGKDTNDVVDKFRSRFVPHMDKASSVAYALDLIKQAATSYGTKQYDFFQYLSQGIAA